MKLKSCSVPVLAPSIQLYFDGQHERWVMTGHQQVVFLDPLSLEVLKQCDGLNTIKCIYGELENNPEFKSEVVQSVVERVIEHFMGKGFLIFK